MANIHSERRLCLRRFRLRRDSPSPPAPLPYGQPSRRCVDTGRERGEGWGTGKAKIMTSVRSFLESTRSQFLADLRDLVGVDCGTHNKAGVDRVGEWVCARCVELGWEIEHYPQAEYGDCWLTRLRGSGQGRVLLMGHLDTVYPDGTVADRPLTFAG